MEIITASDGTQSQKRGERHERVLHWFRADLRLHDNEPLWRYREAEWLLPVFVFPERWFGHSPQGFRRTGPFRARFLLETVEALDATLRARGSRLLILRGDPGRIISRLAREAGATVVTFAGESAPEERAEEGSLARGLTAAAGIRAERYENRSMYARGDLPFAPAQMPDVFTDFRKAVEKRSTVAAPVPTPASLPPVPEPPADGAGLPSVSELGGAVPAEDERAVLRFRGGEDAALERLHTYFWERDRLRSYKWTRNGLLGADYSSKFSPWLAVGALSPRSVHAEVRRYERERKKNVSTYWLIFELIWRDYFFFLAEKYGPRLFHLRGPMERDLPWREDREAFARWCEGRTGEPFIDANMKEIAATGFMSNRGRQNVVSYLARDLAVPWTWGAEYFEELLIDYDPASNWGNWTYNAGVGTDPRPDRYFDPKTQAQKYDPKGDYVRTWMSPGLGL